MIYIGIDSSSTSTAVVVLEDTTLIDCVLFTPKDKDIRTRCSLIVNEVLAYVEMYNPEVCEVILEAPAYMANGKVIDLSMLCGGIFYGLMRGDFSVLLVPPTSHKKKFTGSGKAKKEDMIDNLPKPILERFQGMSKKIDDLADAYSLALFTSN